MYTVLATRGYSIVYVVHVVDAGTSLENRAFYYVSFARSTIVIMSVWPHIRILTTYQISLKRGTVGFTRRIVTRIEFWFIIQYNRLLTWSLNWTV
jgi:hypothetical protein